MYNNDKQKRTMLDGELRDLFATAALVGLAGELASASMRREEADTTAKAAYELADAMVRRRKTNKDEVFRQRAQGTDTTSEPMEYTANFVNGVHRDGPNNPLTGSGSRRASHMF